MYITYAEYQSLGGSVVDSSAFSRFERKARRKLDYFTQDRLKDITEQSDEVKEVMLEFVDKLSIYEGSSSIIKSYSNGVENIGYADNSTQMLESELYSIAVEILPIEYISACVEV